MKTVAKRSPPQGSRDLGLDLIRVIACVAVVLLHCLYTPQFETATLVMYQLCVFAVPWFFMASGYILLNRESVSWRYVLRKLLGILRIVVIWNTVVYVAELAGLILVDGTNKAELIQWAKRYVSYTVRSVFQRGRLWQFWYLGALGAIYLLLPVIHRILGKQEVRPRRMAVCWCVLLVVCVAVQTMGLVAGHPVQEPIHQTLRLWSTFQFFLLGGLMPRMIGWMKEKLSLRIHVILAAVLTVGSLFWRLLSDELWLHGILAEYFYDDLLTIVWIAVAFALMMRLSLGKTMALVAQRSAPLIMGVYILHVPIRGVIRDLFQITGSVQRLGYTVAVLALSTLFTVILRKLPFGKDLTQI